MPTYEYACLQCGAAIEVQATLAEKEKGLKVTCPSCGSKKVAQVFRGFSVMGRARGGGRPPMCSPMAGPGCCR